MLSVLLALAMVVAACGDDDGDDEAGDDQGTETTAGGGPSGDPIKIGVLVTTSGPVGALGQQQVAGLEMARDELNENGGILGRPVELVVKDDAGDPTKASQGMRELIDQEGVQLAYGPTLSSSVLAALAVSTPAGVIQFHSGSVDDVREVSEYPYAFPTSPGTQVQTQTFVDLAEELGVTRLGVLAVNQALGSSTVENLEAAIEGTDLEIVAVEYFDIGAVDVTTQTQRVMGAGAELLIVAASGVGEYAAGVKARNQLNWDVPIASFATMANPLVTEQVGGADGMQDVYAGQVPVAFTEPLPEANSSWLERAREKLGEDPLTRDISQVAAGYDALMIMAEAIEAVGEVDADLIKEYLETNDISGLQGAYSFDEERHDGLPTESLTFVEAASFADGTYRPAELG